MGFREKCIAIKERTPIIDIAVALLKKENLTPENGHYRAPCPMCDAGNRALVINPTRNVFFCWGVKRGGSVIDFVSHTKNISPQQAVDWLEGWAGSHE